MGLTVCPAAVVAAPVEVVWGNLVQWERYSEWADVHVERSEPEGPATVGQTIYFAGKAFGRTWHFVFKVEEVNPERYQRVQAPLWSPLANDEPGEHASRSDALLCASG
jgi:hypothetical protein